MSWIGGGFSNLKDQLTSFTKEVLDAHSEDNTEIATTEGVVDKDKLIADLKEKCKTKDDEIIELKKLVEDIDRRSSKLPNLDAGNTSSQVAKLVCTPEGDCNVSSLREDGLSEIYLGQEKDRESELEREYDKKEIESLKAKLHAITKDHENLTRTCEQLRGDLKNLKKKKPVRLTNKCVQTEQVQHDKDILNAELTKTNVFLKNENSELTRKLLDTMDRMTEMQLCFQKDLQEIKNNNDQVICRLTTQKNEVASNFLKLEAQYQALKKGEMDDDVTFSAEVACQIPEPDNGSSIAESEMSYDSLSDFALLGIKMGEKEKGESVENDNQQPQQQNKKQGDCKEDKDFYQQMHAKNREIVLKYESLDQELEKVLARKAYMDNHKCLEEASCSGSVENQDIEDKSESEVTTSDVQDVFKECNDLRKEIELLRRDLEEEKMTAKGLLEQLKLFKEKEDKLRNELTLERERCETFQKCIINLRETLIQFQQQATISLETAESDDGQNVEIERRRIECLGEPSTPGFYDKDIEILNWLERVVLRLTKSLEDEMERNSVLSEERNKLANEANRLRDHLINTEKMHTAELLQFEERVQELEQDLVFAKRDLKKATANGVTMEQIVNQLTNERNQLAGQIDIIRRDFTHCTTTLQKQTNELSNLQRVIEDFQRNKDNDIHLAMEAVGEKFDKLQDCCESQRNEISRLKASLSRASEELQDMECLRTNSKDQLRTIDMLVDQLRMMTENVQIAEKKMLELKNSMDGKIDKSLVSNLLTGYINAPASSKSQALHVLTSILNIELTDKIKAGIERSDLKTKLPSLSDAFIEFLEKESSTPPQSTSRRDSRFQDLQESDDRDQRVVSLLNSMIPNFPVGENSGIILKDAMKSENDEVD